MAPRPIPRPILRPEPVRQRIAPRTIAPPAGAAETDDHDDRRISVIVHLMIIVYGLIFLAIARLLLP